MASHLRARKSIDAPDSYRNGVVQPLLTDLYQVTMAYAYWRSDKKDDIAVFDLFFRKNPFNGEFTIFAGLEECIKFLENFKLSEEDLGYLRRVLPSDCDPEFFNYLRNISANSLKLYAIDEGMVVFPKVPLITVCGPLPIVQLLETTLLNLVNYASLVATNAARFRLAAGPHKTLLEFGLRRAQGPDGGLSASRYCFMGGFDGTSNVLAGKLFDIPVRGTHAHAFVTSFNDPTELTKTTIHHKETSAAMNLVELTQKWLEMISPVIGFLFDEVNRGELAAFISYALSFPNRFLALVDTYDVLRSGVPGFCAVSLALYEAGYQSQGVRLDSGDLAYLSLKCRAMFEKIAHRFELPWFAKQQIVASNDINEETITSLNQQGHAIDSYGIGTHLVTCQKQPALGCVFKLVEINSSPRIKLSEDINKISIPGMKRVCRFYGGDNTGLVDVLMLPSDDTPQPHQRMLIRHPFVESKRAYVSPTKVEDILKLYWDNGKICQSLPSLTELKQRTADSIACIRVDHKRQLNPTPYKVSVTDALYQMMRELWLENQPIGELS